MHKNKSVFNLLIILLSLSLLMNLIYLNKKPKPIEFYYNNAITDFNKQLLSGNLKTINEIFLPEKRISESKFNLLKTRATNSYSAISNAFTLIKYENGQYILLRLGLSDVDVKDKHKIVEAFPVTKEMEKYFNLNFQN